MKPVGQNTWNIQHRKVILSCGLLFGLVVLAFLPTLHGDFIEFDDYAYVTGNSHIQFTPGNLVWALTHGLAANWHPLTEWSLQLDHGLYGLNPWGYHLTNVLLHAFNTVLVFLVLHRMTGATGRSLVVAALFGLHPLRVESVAWISERKDVLSVMCWLLTLWAYTRYAEGRSRVERRESGAGSRRLAPDYFLALLFFSLGLMSKPMLVTLPGVLLLLDFWPLNRWHPGSWRRLVVEKSPFFLLSAMASVITFVVQKKSGMMNDLVGVPLSFGLCVQNAMVSYGRYLGKLFWPVDLCAFYPHPGHWPWADVLIASLLVFGLSALVFALRRERPYLLTGWFWYLGTLVPVIGLVQVGSQSMADRYSYIPSVGILIALVWEVHRLSGAWRYRNVFWGATGGLLTLACILLTRHQTFFWRDGVTLWRHALAVTGNNYDALNRLGRASFSQGRFDEAVHELQAVVRLNPAFAEAYCSLSQAFAAQGRTDEAIAACQKALEVRPGFVAAHNNLSDFLLRQGRTNEALAHCQLAVEIEPNSPTAQNNLGLALARQGRFVAALAHLRRALALQPDDCLFQANLGSVLFHLGRLDEAIQFFRLALKSKPDNAEVHNNLGGALLSKGQAAGAIDEFQQAVRLQPDRFEFHRNLGHAFMQQGRLDEAIGQFQTALHLNPDNVVASKDLATALGRKENPAAQPSPAKP